MYIVHGVHCILQLFFCCCVVFRTSTALYFSEHNTTAKKKHTSTSTSILKVYTEMHQGVRHLKNHRQTFYDGQLFSLALLYENATNELATKQHTQANEYVHRLVRWATNFGFS